MKSKILTPKGTKKELSKKVTSVNTAKVLSVKTQGKAKKTAAKVPQTALKRLGKGLKDISHLFLSGTEKSSARPSLKTKKTAVAKAKQAVKPALKAVKKKTLVAKKNDSMKTKKNIKKSSKKKTEVIRMPMAKNPEEKAQNGSKITKKIAGSKQEEKTKTGVKQKAQLRPISELSSLFNKMKKTEANSSVLNAKPEQIIEESKFFTGPVPVSAKVKERQLYELPAGYGDTRIIIQARDPYWMHSYWEISEDKMNSVRRDLGNLLNDAKRILRVYDITNVTFNGSNANKYFDIAINDYSNNWYINPQEAGRGFCVDIGYLLADGRFIMLARSNCISMPSDGPSTITDEEWMIVEDDFNRLYGMSVGLGIGLSSMELRKKISQRLLNLSSGVLSSPGAPEKQSARKFWLKVHTELIVYGATVPGAKVTVQDKPINLSKDGTFSLRFALPDGQQVIPVKGVSEDGLDERLITPIVNKKTK